MDAISIELAVDSRCELGEGVVWCERTNAAYWTDIPARSLWQWRMADRQLRRWMLPDRLGALALCESGGLLMALAKGLYLLDVETREASKALRFLTGFDTKGASLRPNDGRADRSGNFVFGIQNEHAARQPLGGFYQFSLAKGLRRLKLGGVAIPNSICFSPDGHTLYFCDTLARQIMCCAYDSDTAEVSELRVFADVAAPGTADGSVIDADGYLWNARWGGFRLVRYDPSGAVDREIKLPVPQPTCLAFAGDGFGELLVTSAREGLASDARAHAGPLLAAFCACVPKDCAVCPKVVSTMPNPSDSRARASSQGSQPAARREHQWQKPETRELSAARDSPA